MTSALVAYKDRTAKSDLWSYCAWTKDSNRTGSSDRGFHSSMKVPLRPTSSCPPQGPLLMILYFWLGTVTVMLSPPASTAPAPMAFDIVAGDDLKLHSADPDTRCLSGSHLSKTHRVRGPTCLLVTVSDGGDLPMVDSSRSTGFELLLISFGRNGSFCGSFTAGRARFDN